MDSLGTRLRELRKRRGLSLRGFARDAGVSAPFVVDIESSRRMPHPDALARMAVVLGVPLSELRALDPRLSDGEREAVSLALTGDRDGVLGQVDGLETWQVERLDKAAELLADAAGEVLPGRHGDAD